MNHLERIMLVAKLNLRSSLCDNNDACILVSATITVPNTEAAAAHPNNRKNYKN